MNVHIARDGAELGECDRTELDRLARVGEIQPTDHYWHEGMADWLLLGDLLGADAWKPQPPAPSLAATQRIATPPPSEPIAAPLPAVTQRIAVHEPAGKEPAPGGAERSPRQDVRPRPFLVPSRLIIPGAILLALVALIALVIHFKKSTPAKLRSEATPIPLSTPASVATSPVQDPAAAAAVKEKAAADLKQRIEKLPSRATPPLYTFYYDVSVNMVPSNSPLTPWTAVIRGRENIMDPTTEQTTTRTEFVVTADYQNDEWIFKHYQASATTLADSDIVQTEHDENTPMPPSLIGMLGLKMKGH